MPREVLDQAELRRAVATEWLVPIRRGDLVVTIQGARIDKDGIRAEVEQLLGEATWRFVETLTSAEPSLTTAELSPYPERMLSAELLGDALPGLRRQFAEGRPVGLRVPVRLLRKERDAEPLGGSVDVWLQRVDDAGGATKPLTLRLRYPITVPDGAPLGVPGVMSALIAAPGPAADLLRDAEPPAHDTWTVTDVLKQRWRYPKPTLDLIRRLPRQLHDALTVGVDDEVPDALLDLFWFEEPEPVPGDGRAAGRRDGKQPARPRVVTEPRPRVVVVERSGAGTGFVVRAGAGLDATRLPARLPVDVAYDVERGDPFAAWSDLDFRLSGDEPDVEIEADGAEVVDVEGCRLVLRIERPDFRVAVHGFDANRDLKVRPGRLIGAA